MKRPTIAVVAGASLPPVGAYDADVIILALDRLDETVEAIRSALSQTGVARHVTILDQGSAPENLAWLQAIVAGRPDATLLRSDRNLGVAEGRNLASGFGHGRVIAGLDNDAVFAEPTTLARMVAALDDEPGLAAVGCRILDHRTGQDDPHAWGYPPALLGRAGGSFLATSFAGAGHAIRRDAWNAAGGYDPALFFCWEAYDFCLRAIARGWRVRYRGDLVIRHNLTEAHRIARSDMRWFNDVRNRLYIERKYGASWWRLLPRVSGYLAKGFRARMLWQTLRAIPAAAWMDQRTFTGPLPGVARAYLRRHDTVHRGSLTRRIRDEIQAIYEPM